MVNRIRGSRRVLELIFEVMEAKGKTTAVWVPLRLLRPYTEAEGWLITNQHLTLQRQGFIYIDKRYHGYIYLGLTKKGMAEFERWKGGRGEAVHPRRA